MAEFSSMCCEFLLACVSSTVWLHLDR
ncbi:hypothetical protein F383_08624 [Gossypium arboreum]|uniref:Uncharacterized protein n=1 Tax=Gossypium arboreum TaxID=29729 RepID=A0A0B0NSF0_GOSAR|nr:hypothetical protein F383_08624 [Gossypium arboreum]